MRLAQSRKVFRAVIFRIEVNDEDSRGLAGGHTDHGIGPGVPPGTDRVFVGRRSVESVWDQGLLRARTARQDRNALPGVVKGGREHGLRWSLVVTKIECGRHGKLSWW